MRYWEIFAEPDGVLIVERKGGYWEFIPNRAQGRPKRGACREMKVPPGDPPQHMPKSPLDLFPPNIDITQLAVV
jgi:hypothetical protein